MEMDWGRGMPFLIKQAKDHVYGVLFCDFDDSD